MRDLENGNPHRGLKPRLIYVAVGCELGYLENGNPHRGLKLSIRNQNCIQTLPDLENGNPHRGLKLAPQYGGDALVCSYLENGNPHRGLKPNAVPANLAFSPPKFRERESSSRIETHAWDYTSYTVS